MYGILDELQKQLLLEYLSDLKEGIKVEAICSALKVIPVDRYDLKSWNQALSYLKGKDTKMETLEDVEEYIKGL